MKKLSATGICEFAIRLEENGEKLYSHFARTVKKEELKKLFSGLAEREREHKKDFKTILSRVVETRSQLTEKPEIDLIRAYADNFLLGFTETMKNLGESVSSVKALSLAIKVEQDSITYYEEMRRFVPRSEEKYVIGILNEEKKHYLDLTALKKAYRQVPP